MRSTLFSAAALLAVARFGAAQTYTDCNPTTNTSCPSDAALGKTITVDFTQGASDQFTLAEGTTLKYGDNGAEFAISKETEAPTISSVWYIFFGTVSVVTRAAPGTGIVSSFILESDDLDEIDWEWLGGDTTQVETNYFGKGNTTSYDRATYVSVSSPQDDFHNYTIDWTKDRIEWLVDGALVRTLKYADANGGDNFPQTPMRVKMGNWDGGASTEPEGTVEWAGGHSDFSKGQTYTMYVKSVMISDGTTSGSEYTYGDQTGSYESIKVSGKAGGSGASVSSSSSASATKTSSASKTASAKASATKSSDSSSTSSASSSSESSGSSSGSSGSSGSSSSSAASTSAAAGANGFSQGSVTTSASAVTHTGAAAAFRPEYAMGALGLAVGYLVM